MTGRELFAMESSQFNNQIKLTNFESGSYFIVLELKSDQTLTKPFIIAK